MDQDPRLIHLALQAAKSLHQLKGLQYDESIPVNMISDVKMSIVELKLPLGCKFLDAFLLGFMAFPPSDSLPVCLRFLFL